MTTAATSSPVSMASNAAFQAWYNEQITQLTAVGLTQTADTGQIGATASIPAINSSAGYTIWRFNDTLQATVPIFIKLEFGAAAIATTEPQMWITIGTATNGAGTLTNPSVRVAVCPGTVPISNVTNYTSRWMYSATDGILWMCFKQGASNLSALGGFIVVRGSTTGGASAGDAVILIANGFTATGSNTGGYMQCWSVASAAYFPTTVSAVTNGSYVAAITQSAMPFGLTATIVGGVAYVVPVYYMNPNILFHALIGIALLTELALGSTAVLAIIGSTTHTFIQVGSFFGSSTSLGQYPTNNFSGMILPWE